MMGTMRRMPAAYAVCWMCLGWGAVGRAAEGEPNFSASLTVRGGTIEYTPEVGKEQATKLGDYLKTGFFDGTPKSTRMAKIKDVYEFSMVAADGAIEDAGTMAVFPYFPPELSHNVFDGTRLIVRLCDNRWKPLKSFDSTAVGKAAKFANGILVYPPEVDAARVQSLGKLMQIDKVERTFRFRFLVGPGIEKDEEYAELLGKFRKELSTKIFRSAPVEIDMCNLRFETLRTIAAEGK